MSWKLPKAEPKKSKKPVSKPETPEGEEDGVTGQYVFIKGRWVWCRFPKKAAKK